MLSPRMLASDLRLRVLLGTAVAALYLGFFAFSADQSVNAVIQGGYWAMLVLTALFVRRLWLLAREEGGAGNAWEWRQGLR